MLFNPLIAASWIRAVPTGGLTDMDTGRVEGCRAIFWKEVFTKALSLALSPGGTEVREARTAICCKLHREEMIGEGRGEEEEKTCQIECVLRVDTLIRHVQVDVSRSHSHHFNWRVVEVRAAHSV